MRLEKGQKAPDFKMETDNSGEISLSDFKGKNLILYFYPKDNTPGCTKEACEFNDNLESLASSNTVVVGVSPDSLSSHTKFREKFDLKFALASDPNHEVAEKYGAWGEKKMYGKTFEGLIRSTFLIDKDGNIADTWYNLRVKGHVDRVKEALEELN